MSAKFILFGFLAASLMTAGCAVPAADEKAVAAPVAEPADLTRGIGQRCFPTDKLLRGLLESHGETMRGVGRVPVPTGQSSGFASLLVSPSGSWSIIVSGSGVSCLLVWGEKWQMAPKGSV